MKPKVLACIAPRENPNFESILSLFAVFYYAQQKGLEVEPMPIPRMLPGFHVLSTFFGAFMRKPDCSHIFLAADDMAYPPETIVRLVQADKDVIGGIYRTSTPHECRMMVPVDDIEKFHEHVEKREIVDNTKYGIGAHTMTIKRRVIEKMIADYPELTHENWRTKEEEYALALPMILDRTAYLDDSAFCWRAAKSGFKIWLDYGLDLQHEVRGFAGFNQGVI